jgi:predicted ATP-grasp superfamily ATP-dependent carboligase
VSIFVTDGAQRSALAVLRALGKAGIAVTSGETTQPSLAGSSRYCRRAVCYPSPVHDQDRFAEYLREEMRRGSYRVLLPMTDITTLMVSDMKEMIRPTHAPIPSSEQVRRAQDKGEVLRLARELNIGLPTTCMLDSCDRIEDVARTIGYPVVIKPRWSRYQRDGEWFDGNVSYANDSQELITKYREASLEIPNPIVQELIEGAGVGVFLLLWDGELKGAFCHRRMREKPPSGGVSVLRESIPLDQELLQRSVALLKRIGWQGVAMVEFKMDGRDGRAKLMEVNGRFWGSLQLSIDAGINFPLMLYRLATGEKVESAFDYRVGVKTRWLLGDLDHLWIRLRNGNSGMYEHKSRLRACLDFLKFYQKDLHYEVFKLHDPRPGWIEAKQYVRSLFGKEERSAH